MISRKAVIGALSIIMMTSFACSNKNRGGANAFDLSASATESSNDETEIVSSKHADRKQNEETINGITYTVKSMSGLDFVERKGENPTGSDAEILSNETVVMFEFQHTQNTDDFFDIEQVKLSKDDAIMYLSGQIIQDFTMEQKGEDVTAEGVLFEGLNSGLNRARVFLFFGDTDPKKTHEITYYDRLFGEGIIKLTTKH